jgi:hypothetical protein
VAAEPPARHDDPVPPEPRESPWDEEAAGMPDPWAHLRSRGFSSYGPEGEIQFMGHFAGGVRRATGWRRVVGITVAALLLTSILGSAFVTVVQLADGSPRHHAYQSPAHLP